MIVDGSSEILLAVVRRPEFSSLPPLSSSSPSPVASREIIAGNFTPEPDSQQDTDIGTLSSKYSLDRRREDERK